MDIAQGEMVEKELTAFIEKRDRQRRQTQLAPILEAMRYELGESRSAARAERPRCTW